MRIAAYDPGESTGWATIEFDGKYTRNLEYGWDACVPIARALYDTMKSNPYDVVIYETWRLRADKAKEFIGSPILPIQAVGFTRFAVLCTVPKTPLIGQEPSIKRVIDRQMAGFGFPDYLPPSDGQEHARDAVRHIYYYLVNKKGYNPNND